MGNWPMPQQTSLFCRFSGGHDGENHAFHHFPPITLQAEDPYQFSQDQVAAVGKSSKNLVHWIWHKEAEIWSRAFQKGFFSVDGDEGVKETSLSSRSIP